MSAVKGTELEQHVVITGANGVIEEPDGDRVIEMVRTMADSGRGVLHFHGGLVAEARGIAIARQLLPVYSAAGAYPIFVIWRSDVQSVISGNLKEIANENAFKRLVKKVLRYAVGKVDQPADAVAKGSALVPAQPQLIETQLARLADEELPFADRTPTPDVPELSQDEQRAFELDIANDERLNAAVAGAVAAVQPEAAADLRSKGVVRVEPAPGGSLLDESAVAELRADEDGLPTSKGLITTTALVRKALRVLIAVIQRFRRGRDHGLYATVVEEVLREFYLGNAGATIWALMKQETADTFVVAKPNERPRGGERIVAGLSAALSNGAPAPKITLVGHSTGAVYIDNLLSVVDQARRTQQNGLPGDFTFRNVVFLAPACTISDFDRVARVHEHLWTRFRMFTMNDEHERKDRLVPVIYPHSLLYLVSGLLERDAGGRSEGGKPLVGLQRWIMGQARDDDPAELASVRAFIESDKANAVWSPCDGPPGFSSGAVSHGAFDDDARVRNSLRVLIEERA